MPTYVKVSGAYKAVAAIYTRVGGVWKAGASLYTKVGGAWKVGFAPEVQVTLDTYLISSGCTDSLLCSAVAGPVAASASGGVAPYTYEWIYASGDAWITPLSGTSDTTSFEGSTFTPSFNEATYFCRVTDSIGTTGDSSPVTIQLTFNQ